MSDERELTGVERLLRSVGAPAEVPAGYEDIARRAALERDDAVVRPGVPERRRQRLRLNRLLPAAAVLVGAAAASLVIGVGGHASGPSIDFTVQMSAVGGGSASGELQLAASDGPMRPVVLKVQGLPPQRPGRYYEMWFTNGGHKVGLIAFNTSASGGVTVRTAIPANLGWTRCWITREDESRGEDVPGHPVLTARI